MDLYVARTATEMVRCLRAEYMFARHEVLKSIAPTSPTGCLVCAVFGRIFAER